MSQCLINIHINKLKTPRNKEKCITLLGKKFQTEEAVESYFCINKSREQNLGNFKLDESSAPLCSTHPLKVYNTF